jgi:hypothetical protein
MSATLNGLGRSIGIELLPLLTSSVSDFKYLTKTMGRLKAITGYVWTFPVGPTPD